MTVSTEIVEHSYYPGAAMAAEAIPFQFLSPDDIIAYRVSPDADPIALRPNIDFVVAGDGPTKLGTIRALTAWPLTDRLFVLRETRAIQNARIVPFQPLPAVETERQLDRAVQVAQENRQGLTRAPMVPVGETAPAFPRQSRRQNRLPVFGTGGSIDVLVGTNAVVALDANGKPNAQPLIQTMRDLGTTFYDDGTWSASSNLTNDGVWG